MFKKNLQALKDSGPLQSFSRFEIFQKQRQKTQSKLRLAFFCNGVVVVVSAGLYLTLASHNNRTQMTTVGQTANGQAMALTTDARNAIVLDAQTGQILGQKGADQQIGVASQSKMLTAYAILQGIKNKKYTWDSMVEITPQSDWSKKDNNTFAHLEITAGEKLPVKELFAAMFTSSANDAAFALADFAKNPQESQQAALTRWAKALKLTGSKWYNAAGQVNSDAGAYQVANVDPNAENTASVRQLAVLAYQDLAGDSDLKTYYQKQGLVYHPSESVNKIKLTEGAKFDQEVKGKLTNPKNLTFEGLKTGSTPASGGALTSLIKDQNGHEYIAVVSGAGNYTDQVRRYQDSVDVVNEVLDHFQSVTFKSQSQPAGAKKVKNSNLVGGQQKLVIAEDRTYWVAKGQKSLGYQWPKRLKDKVYQQGQVVKTVSPRLKAQYLDLVPTKNHQLTLINQGQAKVGRWWQKAYHWLMFW
ncbi:D-alanyl-D-alanine carboxypeptidase family protein [Fructobacillus ficulneus]|uniref:D-alanyl-D-alanine carboxypeptidase n=1 Tax=Fructobacillus ficulneus TaxID=157463 RepID=A0A0K8MJU3_9LACO|nr:serine hydrolase [Fructobacillus ficulneus]GAP00140.1 D-alanyl-D-alanine carboxypeptidase [Fructobacillus ficulneus]